MVTKTKKRCTKAVQLVCESRFISVEKTQKHHTGLLEEIKERVCKLSNINNTQDIDIAVLQTQAKNSAKIWGLIGGGVVAFFFNLLSVLIMYYLVMGAKL